MPILSPSAVGYSQANGWSVALGDILLRGGDAAALGLPGEDGACALPTVKGCLELPPDGLGLPELRTQDATYLSRDGVQHHEDFYEPRIITLQVAVGKGLNCGCDQNTSVRQAVQDIVSEWRRVCSTERELVIYPPNCECDQLLSTTEDIDRPLAVRGRPRQAQVTYDRNGNASLTLRFDAIDHLMRLLDCCGTPESGEQCVIMLPDIRATCREYDRCYDTCQSGGVSGWTYPVSIAASGGPAEFTGGGTECVSGTLRLVGPLTNPSVESVGTDQTISYNASVPDGSVVEIDLGLGTATLDEQDRTAYLSGDLQMFVQPGDNEWRLQAFNPTDTGYAQLCWRPAVVVA